ncbi:hypothetical protein BJV82DRAFT_668609 [Fennellomyces sp. T-0311]|nr:hypothetical protein BJV82DRAFT_668609 [Fennellomyces sp. T-0311]
MNRHSMFSQQTPPQRSRQMNSDAMFSTMADGTPRNEGGGMHRSSMDSVRQKLRQAAFGSSMDSYGKNNHHGNQYSGNHNNSGYSGGAGNSRGSNMMQQSSMMPFGANSGADQRYGQQHHGHSHNSHKRSMSGGGRRDLGGGMMMMQQQQPFMNNQSMMMMQQQQHPMMMGGGGMMYEPHPMYNSPYSFHQQQYQPPSLYHQQYGGLMDQMTPGPFNSYGGNPYPMQMPMPSMYGGGFQSSMMPYDMMDQQSMMMGGGGFGMGYPGGGGMSMMAGSQYPGYGGYSSRFFG